MFDLFYPNYSQNSLPFRVSIYSLELIDHVHVGVRAGHSLVAQELTAEYLIRSCLFQCCSRHFSFAGPSSVIYCSQVAVPKINTIISDPNEGENNYKILF